MEQEEPDEYLRAVIDDVNCYMNPVVYFRLLQDLGEEMNDAQKRKFSSAKGSRGRVTRKIVYLDRLYPLL